jgi:hypothetical protein
MQLGFVCCNGVLGLSPSDAQLLQDHPCEPHKTAEIGLSVARQTSLNDAEIMIAATENCDLESGQIVIREIRLKASGGIGVSEDQIYSLDLGAATGSGKGCRQMLVPELVVHGQCLKA